MIPSSMDTTIESAASSEKDGSNGDGEPSRTCTDIVVEDERWTSVTGLEDLIPDLAAETLRAVQLPPGSHSVSVALLSDAEVRALNKAFGTRMPRQMFCHFPRRLQFTLGVATASRFSLET
jgi:probable rRNA maturation factor